MVEKVNEAKAKTLKKLFKEFTQSKTVAERELIHAKTKVLDDVSFTLINNIRGNTE